VPAKMAWIEADKDGDVCGVLPGTSHVVRLGKFRGRKMPSLHDVLVDRLEQVANEFSTLVADLLAERESVPPDQRAGPVWRAYDERFIQLISQYGDLGRRLQLGARHLRVKAPTPVHHRDGGAGGGIAA
jgi:hypothetical protein